jgi:hypothetical protein
MPWEYTQTSGELRHNSVLVYDKGYSGKGFAKNKPDSEHESKKGPIPRGTWIIGQPYYSTRVGPYAIPLTPSGHNAHGRIDFRFHGDDKHDLGNASEGCIVLPLDIRRRIVASGDTMLYVVR